MLMDPYPSQQHSGLQLAVLQTQQEGTWQSLGYFSFQNLVTLMGIKM